ncbi:MAG: hypothetical protein WCL61_00445 [bacterium]
MWSIFGGLIVVLIGVAMVAKPRFFLETIGTIGFMEKFVAEGESENGWKIIGIMVIFVGFMIMTSLIQGVLYFLLGPALPKSRM